MDAKLQKNMTIAFVRAGMLGYGGGPSSIPLLHAEVVGRYGWMTDEEFADALALANTLPGPIATKMAGYIGYRQAGWAGLVNAVMATVVPTAAMMLGLAGLLAAFRDAPAVRGMTQAIAPVIAVMLAPLAFGLLKEAKEGLGWKGCAGLTAASLLLTEWLHVHPAIWIGALIVFGLAGPGLKPLLRKKTAPESGQSETM